MATKQEGSFFKRNPNVGTLAAAAAVTLNAFGATIENRQQADQIEALQKEQAALVEKLKATETTINKLQKSTHILHSLFNISNNLSLFPNSIKFL